MGRHSKPSTSSIGVAKIAVTGAILGSGSVALASQAQAAPDSEWDLVARCESSGNWAINTGNGYQGGLQFSSSTWLGYGGGQFASAANLASKDQQIAIAEKVLAGQGRGAWPVCGRGLSGPTPRNVTSTPKPAAPMADTAQSTTPLDAVVPATEPTSEPEIVAVDFATEGPAAEPANQTEAPATPAEATTPDAAAPEVVAIDVVTAEPDPAAPTSDVIVTETETTVVAPATTPTTAAAPATNSSASSSPTALEVMSAATGDTPVPSSMTDQVSFLRDIWQAMKDQNLSAGDMLAAMTPAPGQ